MQSSDSSEVLGEEVVMQQQEFLNSALQGVDAIAAKKDLEFSKIIEVYNKT